MENGIKTENRLFKLPIYNSRNKKSSQRSFIKTSIQIIISKKIKTLKILLKENDEKI